jgi:hypothetical protein
MPALWSLGAGKTRLEVFVAALIRAVEFPSKPLETRRRNSSVLFDFTRWKTQIDHVGYGSRQACDVFTSLAYFVCNIEPLMRTPTAAEETGGKERGKVRVSRSKP